MPGERILWIPETALSGSVLRTNPRPIRPQALQQRELGDFSSGEGHAAAQAIGQRCAALNAHMAELSSSSDNG